MLNKIFVENFGFFVGSTLKIGFSLVLSITAYNKFYVTAISKLI